MEIFNFFTTYLIYLIFSPLLATNIGKVGFEVQKWFFDPQMWPYDYVGVESMNFEYSYAPNIFSAHLFTFLHGNLLKNLVSQEFLIIKKS